MKLLAVLHALVRSTAARLAPHPQAHQAGPAMAEPTGSARGFPGLLLIRRPPPLRQAPGSHCRSTLRKPCVPRRSTSVRTGGEAGFLTCSAKSRPRLPITKAAVTGGSPGPAEDATRSGTDPDTGIPAGSASSTPDPPRSTRRHAGGIAALAPPSPDATESSRECFRSACRTAATRPSSCESPGSPQPPARLVLQPDHRSTAPQPVRRSGP